MNLYTKGTLDGNLIELFKKNRYELFVLDIMNASNNVFPHNYKHVIHQSNGECDFLSDEGEKFDAKLPFNQEQMRLLARGKNHDEKTQVYKWLKELQDEASEFSECISKRGNFDIPTTKLYQIMHAEILKNNQKSTDENIVFFIPYTIVLSVPGSMFLQFTTDFLSAIYSKLKEQIDLKNCDIYAIWPSVEKNVFAVRNLKNHNTEFIMNDSISSYITYETSTEKLW